MRKAMGLWISAVVAVTLALSSVLQVVAQDDYTKVNHPFSTEEGPAFHKVPVGSTIVHRPNGITEVYGPDGKRILVARDSESPTISTPAGKKPATYLFKVASADRIRTKGNTTTLLKSGNPVLTIKDETGIRNTPNVQDENWLEWVEDLRYLDLTFFSAMWRVPSPPPSPSPSGPVDFVFNAIEYTNPELYWTFIMQPVIQYNWAGSGRWQASAWHGSNGGGYSHSDPIDVQEGDLIYGEMSWSDSQQGWILKIRNESNQSESIYQYVIESIPTRELMLFCALESWYYSTNNDIPGDSVFYNIQAKNGENWVSPVWRGRFKENPGIEGLDIKILSDSRVSLLTANSNYVADPRLSADLAPYTGIVRTTVVEAARTKNGRNVDYRGISLYSGEIDYKYQPREDAFIVLGDVLPGDSPFNQPVWNKSETNGNGTITLSQNSSSAGWMPATVARLIALLNGRADTAVSVTDKTLSISTTESFEDIDQPKTNTISFLRGDAKPNNMVDVFDSMYIAQYIVGSRPLNQLNALNAATPKHDNGYQDESGQWVFNNGDIIDIFDAMYIAQYIVGNRNVYYEIPQGLKTSLKAVPDSTVSLTLPSVNLPSGRSTNLPISVRGIPSGTAGLGCYKIEITYDPKILRIDSVTSAGKQFPQPQGVLIDNSKGIVRLAGYSDSIPGPIGEIELASLTVTAIGKSGASTTLQLRAETLGDALGNRLTPKTERGAVTLTSGN